MRGLAFASRNQKTTSYMEEQTFLKSNDVLHFLSSTGNFLVRLFHNIAFLKIKVF